MTPFEIILSVVLAILLGQQFYLWWKDRLKKKGKTPFFPMPKSAPARNVEALVAPLREPAVLLCKSETRSTSFLGGMPPDYSDLVWPRQNGHPLGFLACLDLAAMNERPDWLPSSGLLLFFYDLENQPWGFDPDDRGGFAVIYLQRTATLSERNAKPAGWDVKRELKRKEIGFKAVSLSPSLGDERIQPLKLSHGEDDDLDRLRSDLYGEEPHHQIGGPPDAVQDAGMDLECQLVSNGIYCGNEEKHDAEKAERLKSGASEWKLLFQMDSDDEMDIMWGDCGMIYFWVKAEEARRGDFKSAWVILQCC